MWIVKRGMFCAMLKSLVKTLNALTAAKTGLFPVLWFLRNSQAADLDQLKNVNSP